MPKLSMVASGPTKQALLAALLAVIFAASVLATPTLKQAAATAKGAQAITLMSYNIQQLGLPNWIANHFEEHRLELIPETIKALSKRPDVLILQEVFTQYSFDFLVTRLSESYPYHTQVAGEDCNDSRWHSVTQNCAASLIKGNSGVLIFSRWPIAQQHAYVFNAVRVSKSFDFLARKGVVYAKIQVERANPKQQIAPLTLHVFATHLQASVEEHDIRLLQLDEMRHFIDGFQIPASEPVVLGGDFNISSANQSRLNDLFTHSLAEVTLDDAGIGSMSDFTNGYRRLLAGADSDVRPDTTLDYLLYRSDHLQPVNNPRLQVINLKSSTPWLGSRVLQADVELTDLSDHYPVRLELEF